MGKGFKYIIVKDRDDIDRPILFPSCSGLWHKDLTRIHRATDVRLVSAGFCDLKIVNDPNFPVRVVCYGKAESLGANADQFAARKEDEQIIKSFLGVEI